MNEDFQVPHVIFLVHIMGVLSTDPVLFLALVSKEWVQANTEIQTVVHNKASVVIRNS